MHVREIDDNITARAFDNGSVSIDFRPTPQSYLTRLHLTSDQFHRLVRFYNGAHPVAGTVGQTMADTGPARADGPHWVSGPVGEPLTVDATWNCNVAGHGKLLP